MAAAKPFDRRKREIARIHVLKTQLRLSRDQYEAVLGCDSSTELDAAGRLRVIRQMESHLPKANQPDRARPANVDHRLELEKVQALLTDAGRPWSYAEAILRRISHGRKERLQFADGRELQGVITAMELDARKRLVAALRSELDQSGYGWAYGAAAAVWMFGLSHRAQLEKNAQHMSLVLRWLRGELAPLPACTWPRHR